MPDVLAQVSHAGVVSARNMCILALSVDDVQACGPVSAGSVVVLGCISGMVMIWGICSCFFQDIVSRIFDI